MPEDVIVEGLQAVLLASAARTTTQTLAFTNGAGRGIRVVIVVSAYTSGGITPAINGTDALGNAYALTATITKIAATGTSVYDVYPGAGGAAGGVTAATSRAVPRTGSVVLTVDDATPITYSCCIDYIP